MHDRLVSRRIDALHQCFLVYIYNGFLITIPMINDSNHLLNVFVITLYYV